MTKKYYTILHITKDHPKWDEILKVISDIQAKDLTFKHQITPKGEIAIESQNRNQSYRRGGWFYHKHGISYTVVEVKTAEQKV
jgi:hypothetical protein